MDKDNNSSKEVMDQNEKSVIVKGNFSKVLRILQNELGWESYVDTEQKRLKNRAVLDEVIKEKVQEMEDAYESYKNVMPRFSPTLNEFYEKWDPVIALYCKELAEAHEQYCKDIGL